MKLLSRQTLTVGVLVAVVAALARQVYTKKNKTLQKKPKEEQPKPETKEQPKPKTEEEPNPETKEQLKPEIQEEPKQEEGPKPEVKGEVKMLCKSVNYFIARECNYQCRFCFHTDLGRGHVEPLARVKEAMLMLRKNGMSKMNVSGGEPFLQPKLLGEICKFCKTELPLDEEGEPCYVGIVSNGSKITKRWLDEYGKYVNMIAVSLDSADNETNIDIGRDKTGNHIQSTLQAAQLIKDAGVQFKLNTVVTSKSWEEDMNEFIDKIEPVRWKVFQALPIEGENWGEGQHNGRNADDLWITEEQYKAFCDRHEPKQPNMVIESNETMKSSYLLLDEQLRFLDCRQGKKIPSSCILDVGVQEALRESGYFDVEAFYRRDGDFYRAAHQQELLMRQQQQQQPQQEVQSFDIEDCVPTRQQISGVSDAMGDYRVFYSYAAALEKLQELQHQQPKPKWWTAATDNFLDDVKRSAPTAGNTKKSRSGNKKSKHPIILVEGLDGSGKSSVTTLLAQELSSKSSAAATKATVIATPNPKYEEVRAQFSQTKIPALKSAFYMACNFIAAQDIAQAAEQGPVVVDRWWYSTFAYNQLTSAPFPKEEEMRWPTELLLEGKAAVSAGFLLTVSEEERLRRVQSRMEVDPTTKKGEEVYLANDPQRREKIVQIYRSYATPKLTEIDTTDLRIEEVVAKIKEGVV